MIIGGTPSITTTQVRGDTDRLPMDLAISTSLLATLPDIAFGIVLALLGVTLYGSFPTVSAFGSIIESAFHIAPIVIALVGVSVFCRSVVSLIDRRTVKIEDGRVTASRRSLFRSESWSESISAYDGVRWRQIVVYPYGRTSGNRIRPPRYYQILDLKHPDPTRSVTLHVTRGNDISRPKWEQFSKLLDVPAIDEAHGETQVRAAGDVDKSIKELSDEGKIQAEWDERPLPAGLKLMHEGDKADPDQQVIEVTILARLFPVWLYGVILALGTFLLSVGIFDLAFLPVLFGGALGGGVIWHWQYEQRNPRKVRITRSVVEMKTPNPGNPPMHSTIHHGTIESVNISKQVGDSHGLLGAQLVILTDQGEYKTGSGLSREGLVWLRDLILSAVAKA